MTQPKTAHRPEGWWAYPLSYAALVYGFAFIHGLPWWAYPAVGAVAAMVGIAAMRHQFSWLVYGEELCTEATVCAGAAGVSAGGWLLYAHDDPVAHWAWMALWVIVFGGWWVTLCWRAPGYGRVDYPRPGAAAPAPTPSAEAPVLGPYPQLLARAGAGRVQVVALETVGDGAMDIVTVEPLPATGKQKTQTFEGFAETASSIATEVARHYRAEGLRIEAEDVNIVPGRDAAEYQLTVARRRTLADDLDFILENGPQAWARPLLLGLYEDTRPIELSLCHPESGAVHLEIIGATGSGKGVLLAVLLARLLSSDEGEVWLIGTSKLQKLAYGWLLPWLRGDTDRPVIDRVGGPSLTAALHALSDVLQLVELYNDHELGDDARRVSRGKGGLAVVIDEAGAMLEQSQRITLWDGRRMNASELVSAIKRAGRTSPVTVITANQDNLFESSGTAGNKSKRNTGAAIVLNVQSASDAQQPLAGLPTTVNPTKLTDYMFYVRPKLEERRAMRGKAPKLRGVENIAPIAAELTRYRYGLDPAITGQLRFYATRWAPELHPDLTRACARHGWAWPGPAAQDGAPAPTQPAPAGGVATHPPVTLAPEPPDTQEAPVPNTQPPAPGDDFAQALPAGWERADYDVLAALGGQEQPAPEGGGALPPMDVAGLRESVQSTLAAERRRLGEKRIELPDPMGLVVALLRRPNAPEWLSTERLAIAMGRVGKDAPESERRAAAEQLGSEINRQTGLTSEQASRRVDPQRRRGYSRAALMEAATKLLDQTESP